MVCCFCLIVTPLKKGIFFLYLTRLIFTIPLCCTDTKASFHTLCLAHIETLMLHWSMRRLKQFKGSFVWSALESPWSSKLLDWHGVPRLLGKTALWTPVSWSKNVPGRHGLFFFCHGLLYPTQDTPGSVLQSVRDGGGGWGCWRWRDSCSSPLSSWHLTYRYRGSQLEQTRCVVSQLQRLCLWAPSVQSREQVTMSQHLFNSYAYAAKLRVVFKPLLFFFSSLFPTENSTSHDPTYHFLKVILAPTLRGLEEKGNWGAQWHF